MSEKKQKSKSCTLDGCKRKVTITDMICRCGNKYCQMHRVAETHDCSFNFKNIDAKKFMKDCGLGGGKINKISVI